MQVWPLERAASLVHGRARRWVIAGAATAGLGGLALVDVYALADRQAEVAAFAERAALGAARDVHDPAGGAAAALGGDAGYVRLDVAAGRLDEGDAPPDQRFLPAADGPAVRVAAVASAKLPVSGLARLRFTVTAEAFALREGTASLALSDGGAFATGPAADALFAALLGRPLEMDRRTAEALSRTAVDPSKVMAGLEEAAATNGGTVNVSDVLRAAASAAPPDSVAERDVWLALAAGVAGSEASLQPEALVRLQSADPQDAPKAAALPAATFLTDVLRATAAGRTTRFELPEPADGIEAIVFELTADDPAAPVLSARKGGTAALPRLKLSMTARLGGSILPALPVVELPLLLEVHGGSAEVAEVACDLEDTSRGYAVVSARPAQARLRFARGLEPGPADEPVPLAETAAFSAWIRGDTGIADEPPARVTFLPSRNPGEVQTVNAALGLADVFDRLLAGADVVVSVEDGSPVGGAAVRDEVQAVMRDHAPALAAVTGDVLRALGIVPGELAVTVGGVSCTGVRLIR